MWKGPRRRFLLSLSALFAKGAALLAAAAAGDLPGRTFLQITRYDRMPEKFFKPYFDAIVSSERARLPMRWNALGLYTCPAIAKNQFTPSLSRLRSL